MGDEVVLDFEGFVDGVAFEGGKGEQYPLLLGSGYFIPGFEEQVVGAAVGEERDVNVTFPTEYMPELAGKDAVFRIKVHQITRRSLPEWNDDFARQQGFADVSALRRAVMEAAVQKKAGAGGGAVRQRPDPSGDVGHDRHHPRRHGGKPAGRPHQRAARPLAGTGRVAGAVSGGFNGTTMEQLRDHARQQATAAARYELAMTEIARREGIDITEADLDAKYQELSRQYDLSVELLRQQLPPLRLRHDLKLAAAQAVVVDSAKRKRKKERHSRSFLFLAAHIVPWVDHRAVPADGEVQVRPHLALGGGGGAHAPDDLPATTCCPAVTGTSFCKLLYRVE